MTQSARKKLLTELEAELRRSETALAIAQADYEKAYTAVWTYMNETVNGPGRATLAFSPDITMH